MNLSRLMPHLLYSFKDERELVAAIQELSSKFTKERENISDYLKDKKLTSAYTAFYLLTNMPKLEAVFKRLPMDWLEQLKQSIFIDLGAGPGTFSLAFREWLGSPAREIIQIETSPVMREQAKKLWQGIYPEEVLTQFASSQKNREGEKFLFFGHSANEMGAEAALRYIEEINPEHILFVEPGTKEFFPKMLKIREKLIQAGFNILYPCPLASSCPLTGSVDNWCHQYIQVKQDPEIERLSQLARKDRRLLPLIVHAFSRSYHRKNPTTRLFRVFPETKFSFEWEVCADNQLDRYQVMKRGLSKADLDHLSQALAGASAEVTVEKMLEGSKRVKINRLD